MSENVNPNNTGLPTLREGDSGAMVARLQGALNAFGASLATDGQFGPKTDAAVRRFQSSHGLSVDGIVGPKTWDGAAERGYNSRQHGDADGGGCG